MVGHELAGCIGDSGVSPTLEDQRAYLEWREAFAGILDPVFYTIEWLDREFMEGRAIIAHCDDAAGMFRERIYPTGALETEGLLCAGELSSIVKRLVPAMIEYGRSTGAVSVEISSREGWGRTLNHLGFEPHQATVRKMLV